MQRLLTIGAYGFTAAAFFEALRGAGVDTFIDVRQRRGVRGREYAFVNAGRLQARLAKIGIRYRHIKELAPTTEVRAVQHRVDADLGTRKRNRSRLATEFAAAYRRVCLDTYPRSRFLDAVGPQAETVCLFCVEREPEACHRSLVAEHVRPAEVMSVEHLVP